MSDGGVGFRIPQSWGTKSPTPSLTNLLAFAHHSVQSPSGGVYLGDSIPLVLKKLEEKIQEGGFVEMGELLPEF